MACLTIKFISSVQAGSTQGEAYQPFHTPCAVKKQLLAFHEKLDLCSNDTENSAYMLPETKVLAAMDFSKLQAHYFSNIIAPIR